MKDFKYILRAFIFTLLVLLLLASCDTMGNISSPVSDEESNVSEDTSAQESDTEPEVSLPEDECVYSVSVADGAGNPLEDVIIHISGI